MSLVTDDQHARQPLRSGVAASGYRKPPGRPFQKGQSGNPSGKAKAPPNVREMAQRHTEDAVQVLVKAMNAPKAAWPTRVRAAEILIERGHGRAPLAPEDKEAIADSAFSLISILNALPKPQDVVSQPMIDVTPEGSDDVTR